jgi:hypothetical protein
LYDKSGFICQARAEPFPLSRSGNDARLAGLPWRTLPMIEFDAS